MTEATQPVSNPTTTTKEPLASKSNVGSDPSVRAKIQAAKTTLGMKDVNVSAAATAHQKLNDLANKNPTVPLSRLMSRLPTNAAKSYTAVSSKVPTSQLSPNIPLPKFRNTLRVIKAADQAAQAAEKAANESIEVLDNEQISEMLTGGHEQNPPVIIVLRRKGIRIFPDGRRVALYDNKQLGLAVTIPYTGGKFNPQIVPTVATEEAKDIDESLKRKSTQDTYNPDAHAQRIADKITSGNNSDKLHSKAHDSTIYRHIDRHFEKNKLPEKIYNRVASRVFQKLDDTGRRLTTDPRLNQESSLYESAQLIDENLDALSKISKSNKPGNIKFKDGTSTQVHPQVADVIHQLHGALNDQNKKKVEKMISHSAGQFDKIANFAVSKSQWTINK